MKYRLDPVVSRFQAQFEPLSVIELLRVHGALIGMLDGRGIVKNPRQSSGLIYKNGLSAVLMISKHRKTDKKGLTRWTRAPKAKYQIKGGRPRESETEAKYGERSRTPEL